MKFEFHPDYPQQTASEIAYQLEVLAALFGAAGPDDLHLNESALCGLMLQFQAMGKAMQQIEGHMGDQQAALTKKAA